FGRRGQLVARRSLREVDDVELGLVRSSCAGVEGDVAPGANTARFAFRGPRLVDLLHEDALVLQADFGILGPEEFDPTFNQIAQARGIEFPPARLAAAAGRQNFGFAFGGEVAAW